VITGGAPPPSEKHGAGDVGRMMACFVKMPFGLRRLIKLKVRPDAVRIGSCI
jgi:hypothetical protein